jgi:hypothetical protein
MPTNDKNQQPNIKPKVPSGVPENGGMKLPKMDQISRSTPSRAKSGGVARPKKAKANMQKQDKIEAKQREKELREREKELRERQKDRKTEDKIRQKEDKLQKKQDKLFQKEEKRPQVRDLGLEDLSKLERNVLGRQDDDDRRRKIFIMVLLGVLITLVTLSAFLIIKPIVDNGGGTPVEVEIVLEAQSLGTTELIDPNHPELGVTNKLFYPGDSFSVELYITNSPNVGSFPVFLKFKASVEIDGQTTPFIFTPTYHNEEDWIRAYNINNELVDEWAYYGYYLDAYETVQILDALTIKEQLGNEYQNQSFRLVLTVETIEGNVSAIEDFEGWYYAPEEWKEQIESLDAPVIQNDDDQGDDNENED